MLTVFFFGWHFKRFISFFYLMWPDAIQLTAEQKWITVSGNLSKCKTNKWINDPFCNNPCTK